MMAMGDLPILSDMLSDAAVAAELERRQVLLAAVDDDAAGTTEAALGWSLAGTLFATPLTAISGVAAMPRVTAVPGAPAALIGVFGRNGVINSLFDPGALLGVRSGGAGGAVMLLRGTRPRIAIRVDAALSVLDVPIDDEPDGDAGSIARIRVLGDGTRVTIVDTARLIGQLAGRHHDVTDVEG